MSHLKYHSCDHKFILTFMVIYIASNNHSEDQGFVEWLVRHLNCSILHFALSRTSCTNLSAITRSHSNVVVTYICIGLHIHLCVMLPCIWGISLYHLYSAQLQYLAFALNLNLTRALYCICICTQPVTFELHCTSTLLLFVRNPFWAASAVIGDSQILQLIWIGEWVG